MPPLSLYIHIPWCIRKCPYCDFNSHKSPEVLPEMDYVKALIEDLKKDLECFPPKELHSIFIGGGTPSLFSASAFEYLFHHINELLPFSKTIEITLEANPGTVEQQRFIDYRKIGINRLSLGIQSFNPKHLKALGRIHDDKQAHKAIKAARLAGFDNINLDIMHTLPGQSIEEGLQDLHTAISYQPEHLSWYQLTIEPNTIFYKKTPILPSEEEAIAIEEKGFEVLNTANYQRYEISAFARDGKTSKHNVNYWLFGDYIGIGAGAHGKISTQEGIFRTCKQRQPSDYLNPLKPYLASKTLGSKKDLLFEFMLNATRLEGPIPQSLFKERTGLSFDCLTKKFKEAQQKGLLRVTTLDWQVTPFGRRYTNDLQGLFLPD